MSRRKSSSSSSKSSPPKRSAQSSGWGGLLEARQWDKVYDAANSTTAFECDARGRTFLHGACAADAPIHVIEKLMELNEAALSQPDADGQLPFHLSAEHGTSSFVTEVVLKGYPKATSQTNASGLTPLLCAAASGNDQAVSLLLAASGSDPDVVDANGYSALSHAVRSRGPESAVLPIVLQLLEARPKLGTKGDANGDTPLHLACLGGHASPEVTAEIVGVLLEQRRGNDDEGNSSDSDSGSQGEGEGEGRATRARSVRARNASGQLPLHLAAEHCSGVVVELLLAADPSTVVATDEEGRSALQLAALSPTSQFEARRALAEAEIAWFSAPARVRREDEEEEGEEEEDGSRVESEEDEQSQEEKEEEEQSQEEKDEEEEEEKVEAVPAPPRRFSLQGANKAPPLRHGPEHARRAFELSGEMTNSAGHAHHHSHFREFERNTLSLREVAQHNALHRSPNLAKKSPTSVHVLTLKTSQQRAPVPVAESMGSEDSVGSGRVPPPRRTR